jgi:hypothetical protein
MTDRVLHISMGDPEDPWSWWMRWGMAEPRFRGVLTARGSKGLRFRALKPLTRHQRAGLRQDGRFIARGGWWYWQGNLAALIAEGQELRKLFDEQTRGLR